MEIYAIEKRLNRLSNMGLITRQVASQIICTYCDDESKQRLIEENISKIEKMNDEADDLFIQLNVLINEMLY
ncbi:MAG: hypothetical protein E7558_07915 [Ruminococcaceae bacterium]|nr:hypothetical protein [Oscillospiraceae bacterium]MBQ6874092.1 hypothetical protein [Clostridia bacterium]MBR2316060.1 hypothetical protein [Clostridia bacterium]